jgi:hypothetical protein
MQESIQQKLFKNNIQNLRLYCARTWYNETYLESVGAQRTGSRPVPLDRGTPGRRVAVKRRRPEEVPASVSVVQQQEEVGIYNVIFLVALIKMQFLSQFTSTRVFNAPGDGKVVQLQRPVGAVAPNAAGQRLNNNRVRTRVRGRPQQLQQQNAQPQVEEGPPAFALSSDEDIQKFRDSITARFQPQRTSQASGDDLIA